MTLALPPAPQPGTVMTGNRTPLRTFRRQPLRATGRVTKIYPHAIEVVGLDGFYLIDPTTARKVRS